MRHFYTNRILRIVLSAFALVLFSFFKNAQSAVLKKVGKNLYELKTTSALNPADQNRLKSIVAKQYGIRSFNQTVTVHYTPEKGLKGNGVAIAEERINNAGFTSNIIEDGNEDVKQSCIYSDCNSNPLVGDILQLLANYNIE